ncbi:RNA-binding RNA annealing protein, partial [Dimargaris xerosporica]
MSSSLLDKSLDAIVDEHKQKSRRTGGRQRNGGAGGPRRQAAGGRSQQRASHQPYSRLGNVGMVGGVGGGASNSSQIIVTNLDYNVTSKDLRDLFSQIGPVTRANLNFDQKGQSKGTADVHFARRNDAVRAVATYNNVTLD